MTRLLRHVHIKTQRNARRSAALDAVCAFSAVNQHEVLPSVTLARVTNELVLYV